MTKRCSTCTWAIPRAEQHECNPRGEYFCHGAPPSAQLLPNGNVQTVWPIVYGDEQCGMYAVRKQVRRPK